MTEFKAVPFDKEVAGRNNSRKGELVGVPPLLAILVPGAGIEPARRLRDPGF